MSAHAAAPACGRPHCTGHIADGFCDTCGMAPVAGAANPKTPVTASVPAGSAASFPARAGVSRRTAATLSRTSSSRATGAKGASSTSTSVASTRRGMGAGLVFVPPVPARDPLSAVLKDASVAENKRFCGTCNQPVGRSREGVPGRPEGFCRNCGSPYSFTPKLRKDDLVGGQYSVVGCLAHGGLGWIYLATDRNVSDRWVVLKGLLDSGDRDAAAAASAERRYLAEVEHPAIVKIFNFVEHDGAGYIVMEYVGGRSLRDVLRDRRTVHGDASLPLEVALAYAIEILPALGYLHEQGLLFCDFKPDNVIQTGETLKLIDLGGVVRMDDTDSAIYGTVGYQAPEIATAGPSVSSDLFTIGRALAVMSFEFRGYQKEFATALPDPGGVPVLARYDSYYRLLAKATAPDPALRFGSADDMATQAIGVLRQVLAATGKPRPAPSTLLGPERTAGDLLSMSDRPRWEVLPDPIPDPDGLDATFLSTITVTAPDDVIAVLSGRPHGSLDVELRAVRAHLDALSLHPQDTPAQVSLVHALLDGAERTYGWDWRLTWYSGIVALARNDAKEAFARFDELFSELPGELAVRLAMAMSAELLGDMTAAAHHYNVVATTDPSATTAAAGLARSRLALGDRNGAVDALVKVPETSAARRPAQIAAIRALVSDQTGTPNDLHSAAAPDIGRAIALIGTVDGPPHELAALRAEVLEAALAIVGAGGALPAQLGSGAGSGQSSERDIRRQLESCYRTVAHATEDRRARVRLVERANAVRPRSLL